MLKNQCSLCVRICTPLDKTIIGKMSCLLLDGKDEILITELMDLRVKKFTDVGEFLLALDALFILGKIELDEEKGTVKYVS
jgi:hypothetical protein